MTDSASPDNIFQQLYDCVQLGMEWSSEKLESVCPSEKRKKKCKPEQADDLDIGPPCAGRSASCYIKMQDPYAPCCCETKPQPPPCPPKSHRRRSREITCGCDLCKKDIEVQRSFLALCLFASAMAAPSENSVAFQAVTQGAQLFSNNFVKTVVKEKPDNLICSPLSADIALSMAAIGAAGQTQEEFKSVLKLPNTKAQTLEGFQNLIDKLNNVENVTLKLANKLYIGKDFPVKSEYKQDLETYYRSDIQSVDFSKKEEAANVVNTWCKEKTNDRIKSIINPDDIDASTALILANAVYFKGNWARQFNPKLTSDRPFHIDANTVKHVPTMYRQGNYKYAELSEYDAKCIELPYANKEVSMVIILPNKVDGLTPLIDKLEEVSAECSSRLAQTYEREVRLFLPKFRTESKLDLANTLSQKMGLARAFSDSAEFSDISNIPLQISKVVQKAFIEVNEEGSEAAAVTEVEMVNYSLVIPMAEEIRIDRPFIYGIISSKPQEESYITLFTGFNTE